MKWAFGAGILILALAVSGCGGGKSNKPQSAKTGPAYTTNAPAQTKLIITPDTSLIGTVSFVNTDARFVVLTFPVGRLPATDQRLSVYHNGLKVGEVKVSGPQRNDNTVADLTAGNAMTGDEVRDR